MKYFKKLLVIILSLMFSINSIAAVVSENDGAAFITKSEFDNLQNSFQSQIDTYYTSIDNKIDGAIAAYLEGVKITDTKYATLIFNNWKKVECVNGKNVIPNVYKYPKYTFLENFTSMVFDTVWHATSDAYCSDLLISIGITAEQDGEQKRPMVSGLTESNIAGTKTNAVWEGVAQNARETWFISYITTGETKVGMVRETGNNMQIANILPKDGFLTSYYPGINTEGNLVTPSIKWRYNTNVQDTFSLGLPLTASINTSLSVDYATDGKLYDEEHIIAWNKDQTILASSLNFNNTFKYTNTTNGTNIDSNSTYSKMFNYVTKKGQFRAVEYVSPRCRYVSGSMYAPGNSNSHMVDTGFSVAGNVTYLADGTSSNPFPRIGIVGDLKYGEIWQYGDTDNKTVYTYKKSPVAVQQCRLSEGFQLLAQDKDSVIRWNPIFYDVSTGGEVKMYFSTTPFVDGTGNLITVKNMATDTEGDYIVTTDKKADLSFTMPETGLVWCKWMPSNSTTSDSWKVTLDVEASSGYDVTPKE